MVAWRYEPGHSWAYENETAICAMKVRFEPDEGASSAGKCDCGCGACAPEEPHLLDRGCACGLLGCYCLV
jgi:hypothetical protein